MKEFEKKAKAYALKNAIAHKGKAIVGAVVSSLFAEGLKKEDMKKYGKKISEIVGEVNKLNIEEQKKEFEELKELISEREVREGLPELPDVPKTGVIMRFAPSPSGGLHFGHALTLALNYDYVKKYGGKLYIRIEDTNPENIYPKAYKLIEEDSKWLCEGNCEIVIQSDRMEIYYKYIEELIKKNSAYVCTCSSEEFREYVKEKKPCPCRALSVKENLERWKKMLNKEFKQGEAVVRFKTPEKYGGMNHKNPAMRDFPLARINEAKHPRVGEKYSVWPLMNLSVSVDDIEMKMTHIIRAKDHRDNAERQKMIFESLGKKYPWSGFLGRWHIKGLKLSSSQITKDVLDGKYSGWDDEKLPTIASLRKTKKYPPQVFWKIAEQRGLSEVDKVIDKKDFFELMDRFRD